MKQCLCGALVAVLSCAGEEAAAPSAASSVQVTPAPGPSVPAVEPTGSGSSPTSVVPPEPTPTPEKPTTPENPPPSPEPGDDGSNADAGSVTDAGSSGKPPDEAAPPGPPVEPPNPPPDPEPPKPLAALLITGGCYHDYAAQAQAIEGLATGTVQFDWTVLREECTNSNSKQLELYNDPNWAKPYAIVVHNECFADTSDAAYIRKITEGHRAGTPSLVIHCAMHTYRAAAVDDWREFLGVTTREHEAQRSYPVKTVAVDHPIVAGLPADWVTPMDELYVIEKLWPNAQVLASTVSPANGEEHPVVWVNDYYGTRVAGVTYGHSKATFDNAVYLDLLARALRWAVGKEAADW